MAFANDWRRGKGKRAKRSNEYAVKDRRTRFTRSFRCARRHDNWMALQLFHLGCIRVRCRKSITRWSVQSAIRLGYDAWPFPTLPPLRTSEQEYHFHPSFYLSRAMVSQSREPVLIGAKWTSLEGILSLPRESQGTSITQSSRLARRGSKTAES